MWGAPDTNAELPQQRVKLQLRSGPSHVMQFALGIWQNHSRSNILQSCASYNETLLKSPKVQLPCRGQHFVWIIREGKITMWVAWFVCVWGFFWGVGDVDCPACDFSGKSISRERPLGLDLLNNS